ncbi:DUF3769 domain-containing protein [Prochlorococcus marinus]|uniref:Repeats containing protein n=1 Tax=Prochlorococcus marinus str. GP2 TaxID=59925 RepID=A0A0A1Z744_PROMR|nr:DUF3769 domain-containing protein [Prochlorococcus marinus]KGF85325.1 hypothetical protein EU91_1425 [Prochlorococcus marinus str. GP2]
MKNFQQINLFIFLNGLLIFDFLPIHPIKIFAKDLDLSDLTKINNNSPQFKPMETQKGFDFSISNYISKNKMIEDLKANGDGLFNLLAFEQKDLEEEFFVEIDSDLQYRDKDLFVAEGNAIIYLSDATLSAELVKYDLTNKILTVVGNVIFKKGEQYFEASKLIYNLKEDTGNIYDVYGLLDSKTFGEDFKLELDKNAKKLEKLEKIKGTNQPKYINTATIGLVNKFEDDKAFNITDTDLEIPKISRWRYKTNEFIYNSKTLESKKIYFTNDIYNKPQFIFLSKNFSAEIIDNKLRLLSKNSWIILDNKLKIPIGRQSVIDKEDSLIRWGFGADFDDKDGYFFYRSSYPKKIFRDFSLQLQPYFLIQRALKGNTNAFRAKNTSVFSGKEKNDISFSDYLALDLLLNGKEKNWNIESKIQLNSLDISRLDESLRTKLILSKRINLKNTQKTKSNITNDYALNKISDIQGDLNNDKFLNNFIGIDETADSKPNFKEDNSLNIYSEKNKQTFTNLLDIQIYNIFREKVVKDFATEEIHFASGFNIANKKAWLNNEKYSSLSLIYDLGHFKSKSRSVDEFRELFRNSFVGQYNYQFPIWKKNALDKTIDKTYKFTPNVISQSLDWSTAIQSGIFLYSDGSNQNVLKFKTGPVLTIGSFKKKILDYTKVRANYNYTLKEGQSPFSFDNIDDEPRINLNLQQQIFGPLLLSFDTSVNLNTGSYTNVKYGLDFKRRAYSIGAFYNSTDKSAGIKFNIFNFDYSGLSDKF